LNRVPLVSGGSPPVTDIETPGPSSPRASHFFQEFPFLEKSGWSEFIGFQQIDQAGYSLGTDYSIANFEWRIANGAETPVH